MPKITKTKTTGKSRGMSARKGQLASALPTNSVDHASSVRKDRGPHVHQEDVSGQSRIAGNGPHAGAGRIPNPPTGIILTIINVYKRYLVYVATEGDMSRRIKSLERTHSAIRNRAAGIEWKKGKWPEVLKEDVEEIADMHPILYEALGLAKETRNGLEKELCALVRQLPVWDWWSAIPGCKEISLATIVGEAGNDLVEFSDYPKLWKRLGLGNVQLPDGTWSIQAKRVDPTIAAIMGYNPRRRARIRGSIGTSCIMVEGPYREIYLKRKEVEREKAMAEGLTVLPSAQIATKTDKSKYRSVGHIDRRAKRYMEKKLVRDLWRHWVSPEGGATSGLSERTSPVMPHQPIATASNMAVAAE